MKYRAIKAKSPLAPLPSKYRNKQKELERILDEEKGKIDPFEYGKQLRKKHGKSS